MTGKTKPRSRRGLLTLLLGILLAAGTIVAVAGRSAQGARLRQRP